MKLSGTPSNVNSVPGSTFPGSGAANLSVASAVVLLVPSSSANRMIFGFTGGSSLTTFPLSGGTAVSFMLLLK